MISVNVLGKTFNITVIQAYSLTTDVKEAEIDQLYEDPEIKLPTSARSSKKQDSSRKTSISALLTMPKPLTVWITISCGKF